MRRLCPPVRALRARGHSKMYNRLTTIVAACLLGLGMMTTASAGHHRHRSGSIGYLQYASLDVSLGTFCAEHPLSCQVSPVQREMSHAAERVRPSRPHRHGHGLALSDLTPTLEKKVSEIMSACGARLISGYRPGARVAGSGHPSLHSVYPSRAADVAGNPHCIYAHLQGWPGGYSIDYGSVRHVHISYSPPGSGFLAGREWHARFAHYGGGHHRFTQRRRRYAMR
jgi:hypothetical protein